MQIEATLESTMSGHDRYAMMPQRRSGRSGLVLPAITLGLWHNFGSTGDPTAMRGMLNHAFDSGIFHIDLANNYGPPYGHAEEFFGRVLKEGLGSYRNELVISTKAGWDMWPGPFGEGGSRKYLLTSLDDSLARMGIDYVDIFYSHRYDPDVPLEETMGALADAVRQGKALYVGVSSYSPENTARAASILDSMGVPLTIHQPSYSMLNRWVEDGLLDVLAERGVGCIAFSPLAQGMLTTKYLDGIPAGSRATKNDSLHPEWLTDDVIDRIRSLNDLALERGQTLAQMAIAWVLRDTRVTSALIGASSVSQLEENIKTVERLAFTHDELVAIDQFATDAGIDLWKASRLAESGTAADS